jgi:hypothetical protein
VNLPGFDAAFFLDFRGAFVALVVRPIPGDVTALAFLVFADFLAVVAVFVFFVFFIVGARRVSSASEIVGMELWNPYSAGHQPSRAGAAIDRAETRDWN